MIGLEFIRIHYMDVVDQYLRRMGDYKNPLHLDVVDTCDEWGIKDSRRGYAESGIVLSPMSRRYRSTAIKVLWILCLVHQ